MKENRTVRKKAKDPSTGRSVHAQGRERSNHDLGLNMIKEAGEVEEEDAADAISGNAIPGFEPKKSSSIGSGEEFAGSKLAWAQKIVTKVERTKPGGNNFLEQFAVAFKKGDGAISFGEGIVGFLGFRDDHDFSFAPRIKMKT